MSKVSCSKFDRLPYLLSVLACLCFSRGMAAADSKTVHANLSVEQVVAKHVAARGGVQAWHSVQTLSVSGKMDAGNGDSAARSKRMAEGGVGASVKRMHAATAAGAAQDKPDQQVQLPFKLEMKRPHKSRLEIEFAGKTAVQVYDGANGWKLRPYLNRNEAEPFTAEEAKSESNKSDMEGPLVDYAAKGIKVELAGVEPVEGHTAYKLKLTMKNGDVQRIWIDAQSFLDVKVEGLQRRMDDRMHNVWIYQRDFRSVQGVMVPYVLDTVVEGFPQTHRMTIESVAVNRTLDDSRFTKPQVLLAQLPVPAASHTAAPANR
jgi:outer membrane lipoprotein-sorting protein